MPGEHEHTLNVWTAGLLRSLYGLDARQEQTQEGGKRIDIEVRIGPVKIAAIRHFHDRIPHML